MTGIVGAFSQKRIDDELLDRMIESVKHTGDYKVDKYVDLNFGIARVHRGIFNPESQPIFNKDKSILIFMDGKIYDYEKEMKELIEKGYDFNYQNDPEFCLHSFEEYGMDFIKDLNGSFVLLIYDIKNNRATIANDRYGFRVHYYKKNDHTFLLAPEVKTILETDGIKKELNNEAVVDFFAFGQLWNNRTFFKDIKVLPAASIVTHYQNKISIKRYWEFKYEPDYEKSTNEFVNELYTTFKKAVEIRVNENYKYAVTLSGGLDSRSVIAAIPFQKRKKIIACTFGSEDCDEAKISQKVTKSLDIENNHFILETSPELLIANGQNEIFMTDGRNYMGVSFAYPLLKTLQDRIEVILDGFAMDLTVGGSFLNEDILKCKNEESLHRIIYQKRLFCDEEFSSLFNKTYYEKIKQLPLISFQSEINKIKTSHLANKSDQFFINTLVAWMHIGDVPLRDLFEVVHPSSDNEFINVVRKIPPEWRVYHKIYRLFLKKISSEMANIPYHKTMLPPYFPIFFWKIGKNFQNLKELLMAKLFWVTQGKIIFHTRRSYVNFDEWFRTNENWRSFFKELLLNENSKSDKFLNQSYIEKLFYENITGKKDNSMKLLYIASFKIFLRLFL